MRTISLVALVSLSYLTWAVAPPPAEPVEVKKWIADLEADEYSARKIAMDKLTGLGQAAVPALKRACNDHPDPDVRLRAIVTRAAIEEKLYGVVRRFTHTHGVLAFALSPNGKRMASTSGNDVHIFEVETGKQLHALKGHTSVIYTVAWSADGKRLLSGGMDTSIRLWNADTGKPIKTLLPHTPAFGVLCVVFTPDGKKAISGGYSRDLRIWDLDTGKVVTTNSDHTSTIRGLAIMPGGKRVATASFDGTVRVIDIATGKQVRRFDTMHVNGAWFVAVSPDGKWVASSGWDWMARIHDVETGKLVKTLNGHTLSIHGIAFSGDSKHLMTASYDRTARLWEVASGKEIQRFFDHQDSVSCVAFLPDGRRGITACMDRVVRLWNLRK